MLASFVFKQSLTDLRRPLQPHGQGRSAFTLLEVLLALGLSVVLLAAVAAAIDLYRRMTNIGQQELREARLARAILHKIESDIRAVVPPQPASSSSSSSSGSSSSSSTSTTASATAVLDPTSADAQSVFGLYGDSRTLLLNALCPQRSPATIPQLGASTTQPSLGAIHADLKTIAYYVVGGTGGSLATGQIGGQAGGQTNSGGTSATSGLARLEGDRVAINYAMQQSAIFTSGARIVAPEVTSIGFRYFDGVNWLVMWDGASLQSLPMAVEVTITVASTDDSQLAPAPNKLNSNQIRTYRHVVAIPTAVPSSTGTTTPTGTAP